MPAGDGGDGGPHGSDDGALDSGQGLPEDGFGDVFGHP
jgi:hypothetical protein